MGSIYKSLSIFFGVTAIGLSGYAFYIYLHKKDEDDNDPQNTFSRASNFRTVELKVPIGKLRILIGRNGKILKDIEDRSHTKINFDEEEEGCEEVICFIRGTTEDCCTAENLIKDFINNQPLIESEDIWVVGSSVGNVIGRGGVMISEIKSFSGAMIKINDEDRSLPSRRITIKGTREQINVAKSLIEDVVAKAVNLQQKLQESLALREPRLPPRSPEKVNRVESPKVERISPIPGQPDTPFEVYVSAMVDPSRFWVQIVGPKATELDCLVEEMTEYYGIEENRNLHVLKDIKKGDLVAASFQYDNKWYRAEVLNVLDEDPSMKQAELYYVDYGDTDIVPWNDAYELRTDFLRLHFQAIECFLAKVEPNGDEWSEEAKDKFEEWTHVAQWKKLSAKMNGYSVREKTRAKREGSPVPGIDLYELDEHDIDIGEELVKIGLAVYKSDAFLSNNANNISDSNISVSSSVS
nr:tudor and KH domain-containing protein homolog [Leptinotarsa decemlineata]